MALSAALLLAACCGGADSSAPPPPPSTPLIAPPVAPSGPQATPYDAAYVGSHLARLQQEAGCAATPSQNAGVFCAAAAGWPSGAATPLPTGNVTRLGLTTWIPTQGSVEAAFLQEGKLSGLGIRNPGAGPAYATLVTPQSRNTADTAPQQVASQVLAQLRGQAVPLMVPGGLYMFLSGLPARAEYAVAPAGNGWQLQGGSFADLRRVGDRWVAVEVPRQNPAGLYFTVFLDSPFQGLNTL